MMGRLASLAAVLLCGSCIQVPNGFPPDAASDGEVPDGEVPDGGALDGGPTVAKLPPDVVDGVALVRFVDFDEDGDDDLLVASTDGGSTTVGLHVRDDDAWGEVVPVSIAASAPGTIHALVVGDVDADGDLDLVVNVSSPEAGLFFVENGGEGARYSAGATPLTDTCGVPVGIARDLTLSDLDGDGTLEIVSVREDGDAWVAKWSSATRTFECTWTLDGPIAAVAGLRGDPSGALVVASRPDGRTTVHRIAEARPDNPTSQQVQVLSAGGAVARLAAGDLDDDGVDDLVTLGGGELRVLRGRRGRLDGVAPVRVPLDASELLVDDVDGDGRVEVVASGPMSWRVLRLTGNAWAPVLAETVTLGTSVAVGRPDVMGAPWIASVAAGTLQASSLIGATASCPDADGDGHRDAACGGDDCDDRAADVYPGATVVCGNGRLDACGDVGLASALGSASGEAGLLAPWTPVGTGSRLPDDREVVALDVLPALLVKPDRKIVVGYVPELVDGTRPVRFVDSLVDSLTFRGEGDLSRIMGAVTLRGGRGVALRGDGEQLLVNALGDASDDDLVFGWACELTDFAGSCNPLRTDTPAARAAILDTSITGDTFRRVFLEPTGPGVGSADRGGDRLSYVGVAVPLTIAPRILRSEGDVIALLEGDSRVRWHPTGTTDLFTTDPEDMRGGVAAIERVAADEYVVAWTTLDGVRIASADCAAGCALGAAVSLELSEDGRVQELALARWRGGIVATAIVRQAERDLVVGRWLDAGSLAPRGDTLELHRAPEGQLLELVVSTAEATEGGFEGSWMALVAEGSSARDRSLRVVGARVCAEP